MSQTKLVGKVENVPAKCQAKKSSDTVRGTDEGRPFGMRQTQREREGEVGWAAWEDERRRLN